MIRGKFARRSALHALCACVALTACEGDDEPFSTAGVTGRTGDGAGPDVEGYVVALRGGAAIEGARVCIIDNRDIPCGVSDADGHYAMRVPRTSKSEELAVHVSAPGHLAHVGMVRESPTFTRGGTLKDGWWQHMFQLLDDTAASELTREWKVGGPSADRGLVKVDVWYKSGGAPQGAQATLAPEDRLLSARTASVPKSGQLLFADVPPGRFDVSVAGCTPSPDLQSVWKGRTRGAVGGLAVAGAISKVVLTCQEDRPDPTRER